MLYYELMLHGDDGLLNAVATVLRNPQYNSSVDRVFGAAQSRASLEMLRAIPFNMALVSVYYPALDRRVIINQPIGSTMNDEYIYGSSNPPTAAKELPRRLIGPAMSVTPPDKTVTFCEVHNVKDVLDSPPQSVLLFTDSDLELLQVVVDHPLLFGFNCFVLTGLPTADYSTQFEASTYKQDKVPYATFVNELLETARVAEALRDESQTNYQREQKHFTRRDGSVKEFTKHVLATDTHKDDDDTAVEE